MGQHGQRLITRELVFLSLPTTSWSYFYSPGFRRVTLLLSPSTTSAYIKKVTIEVIVPKWPLISRKETASEYDKINNFAMIRPPFVTIEGQFLSVITVINMLHFFNQLIVYTIWKLAFSKLTKITPLTLFHHLSIQCMSRRDLSVKGGRSERCYRTMRGRTDEQRYAILSPYFDGRIQMNTSWNYEYIIFQNFHQFG